MSLSLRYKLWILAGGLNLSVMLSATEAFLGEGRLARVGDDFKVWILWETLFCGVFLVATALSRKIEWPVRVVLVCILLWAILWGIAAVAPNLTVTMHIAGGILGFIAIGTIVRREKIARRAE